MDHFTARYWRCIGDFVKRRWWLDTGYEGNNKIYVDDYVIVRCKTERGGNRGRDKEEDTEMI